MVEHRAQGKGNVPPACMADRASGVLQAFETWQFNAAEAARFKFMLAGALKRMINRKLSMVSSQESYASQAVHSEACPQ